MKGIRRGKLWQNKKKNVIDQNKNLKCPQKRLKQILSQEEDAGQSLLAQVSCQPAQQEELTVVTAAEHKAAEMLLHPCSKEVPHSQIFGYVQSTNKGEINQETNAAVMFCQDLKATPPTIRMWLCAGDLEGEAQCLHS